MPEDCLSTCRNGHPKTPENAGTKGRCLPCRREEYAASAPGRKNLNHDSLAFPCGHPRTPDNIRRTQYACATCHRLDRRKRYAADPEAARKNARDWGRQNKERKLQAVKDWQTANPDKLRRYSRNGKHARRSSVRDPETVEYLDIIAKDPCVYCGKAFEQVDHIHAVKRGGTNHWTNYAPACGSCNKSKSASSLLDFLMRRSSS